MCSLTMSKQPVTNTQTGSPEGLSPQGLFQKQWGTQPQKQVGQSYALWDQCPAALSLWASRPGLHHAALFCTSFLHKVEMSPLCVSVMIKASLSYCGMQFSTKLRVTLFSSRTVFSNAKHLTNKSCSLYICLTWAFLQHHPTIFSHAVSCAHAYLPSMIRKGSKNFWVLHSLRSIGISCDIYLKIYLHSLKKEGKISNQEKPFSFGLSMP